jgi:hypothetical protein
MTGNTLCGLINTKKDKDFHANGMNGIPIFLFRLSSAAVLFFRQEIITAYVSSLDAPCLKLVQLIVKGGRF